jgi:hypothetical protein
MAPTQAGAARQHLSAVPDVASVRETSSSQQSMTPRRLQAAAGRSNAGPV